MIRERHIRFQTWLVIATACLLATIAFGGDVPSFWSALQ
jgi:hypothetical protein